MGSSPDSVLYDQLGNALAVQPNTAIPASTPALMVAGSDGTNSRYILVDGSARQIMAGAGVAGTPAGGVVSIQGVAGGIIIPISGTVTANAGTGNFAVVQATAANLNATVVASGNFNNASVSATAASPPASATYVGGSVTTAPPTYTTGQMDPLSLTTAGLLRVDGSNVTQPISGTVTANAGIGTFTVAGTVTANQGGTWTVQPGNTANTTPWLVTDSSDGPVTPGAVAGKSSLIGGQFNTVLPTLTNTQQSAIQLDSSGRVIVVASGNFNNASVGATATAPPASATYMGALATTAAESGLISGDMYPLNITTTGQLRIDGGYPLATAVATAADMHQVGGIVTTAAPAYTTATVNALSLTIAGLLRVDGVYPTGVATGADSHLIAGAVTTAPPAYTTGQMNNLSLTITGLLRVDGSNVIQPVSGTVTANQGTPASIANSWNTEITDGTNGPVAVKAANTAPVAADRALVVTMSPNTAPISVTVTAGPGSTPNLVFGDITLSSNASTVQINRTAYTEQTANFTGSIKSSSANDAAAGTGARTLTIYYVDATGATAGTETVTLNGTTAVNLVTTTKCFIEKMIINTVGTGLVNAGTISLFTGAGGAGTTVGTIGVGDNRTQWCHHYVISGKTCNVTNLSHSNTSTVSGGQSTAHLRALTLNLANAAEIQVSEFIDVAGAANPSLKAYVSTIQVAGPARLAMYVLPGANTTTIYRGSIDCFNQ
jgi:hypothetical protein